MSPARKDVDAYLAALPGEQRAALQKLRESIRAAAPEAVESIGYGMPAFKYNGRPLIFFGAAKNHCAIYGEVPEALVEDLKDYYTSKGTIRFQLDKPLPAALVKKLVKTRIAEIEARESGRKKKKGVTR